MQRKENPKGEKECKNSHEKGREREKIDPEGDESDRDERFLCLW